MSGLNRKVQGEVRRDDSRLTALLVVGEHDPEESVWEQARPLVTPRHTYSQHVETANQLEELKSW